MTRDWPFDPLVPMKYGAILADPPWRFALHSAKGEGKSPQAHYDCMTTDDIAALPVGHLASRDCMLFLWATWPMLPDAMRVMEAWGFNYVTGGPWLKRTRRNFCVAMGTGYVMRSASEPFLIGRTGRPRVSRAGPGAILGAGDDAGHCDVAIDAVRREHSRKPVEMRAMIEKMLPDVSRCELFARETWLGNEVWGNEADRFSGVTA